MSEQKNWSLQRRTLLNGGAAAEYLEAPRCQSARLGSGPRVTRLYAVLSWVRQQRVARIAAQTI